MKEIFSPLPQTTIGQAVSFAGVGLFTAAHARISLLPAPAGHGIVFKRVDLPSQPLVQADLDAIQPSTRCTLLSVNGVSIQMVEHLLSAIAGMGIDNLLIELSGPEIPAGDGSAIQFVELFAQAGIKLLEAPRKIYQITHPIYHSDGNVHLVALPSPGYRVSYTLHYPHSPLIRSQFFSMEVTPETYRSQIANCRTFSLYEEIAPFIEKGVIKGGGLDNALVIRGNEILNPGGARFPDEMVRHKVLDLIGDLALLGAPIEGHIIALRSGHATNANFAKVLRRELIESFMETK